MGSPFRTFPERGQAVAQAEEVRTNRGKRGARGVPDQAERDHSSRREEALLLVKTAINSQVIKVRSGRLKISMVNGR